MTGRRLHQRVTELELVRLLLCSIRKRLAYTLAPPWELLRELAEQENFRRCQYLVDAVERMKSGEAFSSVWRESIEKSTCALNDADRRLLEEISNLLGRSDLQTQEGQLDLLIEQAAQQLTEARRSAEQNAKLAATLGILCGMAVFILQI